MNTRIDGPGIAGTARAKYPTAQGVWKITPDAHGKDCPCAPCRFRHNLRFWQTWHKSAIDANHSAKPESSTTPDPQEPSDDDLYDICASAKYDVDGRRRVYRLGREHGRKERDGT